MEQLFHFHTGADGVVKVNGNPFDCSILLKNMYTVEAVSLETVEMAHGFYNIRSPFDTFTVDGTSYSIPDGNYTIDTLLTAMSSASGYTFEKVGDRINEYHSPTDSFNTVFAAPYQTVSNNGLTVTALPSMWASGSEPTMLTLHAIPSGSAVMFSVKAGYVPNLTEFTCVGLASNAFINAGSTQAYLGGDNSSSVAFWEDGAYYSISSAQGYIPGFTTGDIIDLAIDTYNFLIQFRVNGGSWTYQQDISFMNGQGPLYFGVCVYGDSGGAGSMTLQTSAIYPPPSGYNFIPALLPGILTVTQNSLLNLLGYSIGNPSGTSTKSYSFPFDKYITIWMENIGTSSNENQKITYKVPISSAKTFWSNNSFNNQIVRNQNSQFPLNRLNIQVLDQFGTKINNNFVDWSFTLKVRGHRCLPQ
jgi:hypothetical protein